jgi:hypothetical protein
MDWWGKWGGCHCGAVSGVAISPRLVTPGNDPGVQQINPTYTSDVHRGVGRPRHTLFNALTASCQSNLVSITRQEWWSIKSKNRHGIWIQQTLCYGFWSGQWPI